MSGDKQIFQSHSTIRWTTIKWISRLLFFILIAMIPLFWLAMGRVNNTILPGLVKFDTSKSAHAFVPPGFNKKEMKKYHGFDDFLNAKKRNIILDKKEKEKNKTSRIRAAYYVDWDPQALYSLKNHISELNTVLPEWFFIDPVADTLITNIDKDAYDLMKKNPVRIIPMLKTATSQSGRRRVVAF